MVVGCWFWIVDSLLMFVARCSSCGVRCLLFGVRCLMFDVCLFVVCGLWLVVYCFAHGRLRLVRCV